MREDSNVAINCLKPSPSTPPRRPAAWHLEAVEADLEFLHAAIAEHPDFGARHAGRRERLLVGAARLLGEQHGKPVVALASFGLVRTSSTIRSARAACVMKVLAPWTL